MNHALFKNDSLPSHCLGVMDPMKKYQARFKEKAVVKCVKALARMELLGKSMHWESNAADPRQKEADSLFTTIDSLGDKNGSLELFEIILYMQERYHTVSHHHTQCHIIIHSVTSSYL
jgi:hypothetical protein